MQSNDVRIVWNGGNGNERFSGDEKWRCGRQQGLLNHCRPTVKAKIFVLDITLCTMEFDNSECSSGCESGWTVYLENSIMAPYSSYNNGNKFLRGKARVNREEEEEEEDLSMVSDASSGPPQVVAEDDYGNDSHGWLQNLKEKASMLDDTASSPIFNCTNNNFTIKNQTSLESVVPDFSQGYSTTQFQKRLSEKKHIFMQGQSAYQEHCEFFQSSLLPANQFQQNQTANKNWELMHGSALVATCEERGDNWWRIILGKDYMGRVQSRDSGPFSPFRHV
nr:digestive organ expansion factor homolog [Ipomoea batatas]